MFSTIVASAQHRHTWIYDVHVRSAAAAVANDHGLIGFVAHEVGSVARMLVEVLAGRWQAREVPCPYIQCEQLAH